MCLVFDPNVNKFALTFRDDTNDDYCGIVGVISGTSSSWGSRDVITTNSANPSDHLRNTFYDSTLNRIVAVYRDSSTSSNRGLLKSVAISSSSSAFSPTFASTTAVTWSTEDTLTECSIYDPDQKVGILVYQNHSESENGYSRAVDFKTSTTNLTSENYIGVAAASVSDSASATIDVSGAANSNQSSLTAGQKYYVQGDGTLGLAAATPKVFAGTAVSATKLIVNDQQPIPTSAWTLLDSGTKTDSGQAVIGGSANFIAASCSAYNWFELHWCYHGTAQTHVGFNTSFNGSNWQTNSDNVIYMDGSHVATDSTTDDNNKRSGDSGDPRLTDAYNSMQNYHGVTTFSFPHDTTRYKMMITRFGGWNSTMAQYNIRMITGTAIHGNRGSTDALTGLAIWNNSGYGNPVSWRLLGG